MDITFSIVTWNSMKTIANCIDSIAKKITSLQYEVWVVDNNSKDGTPKFIEITYPWVKMFQHKKNLGYSKANNIVLQKSTSRYAVIMNPDIILHDNFESIIYFLDAKPDVGAATPLILNPDLSVQIVNARRFPTITAELIKMSGLDYKFPKNRLWGYYSRPLHNFEVPQEIDAMQGSCMVCRQSVLRQINYMDERYFMYAEDFDLCREIKKAGWKNYHYPHSKVIHGHESNKGIYPGGVSTRQVSGTWLTIEGFKSKYEYFVKHKGILYALLYRVILSIYKTIHNTKIYLNNALNNQFSESGNAIIKQNNAVILWCLSLKK